MLVLLSSADAAAAFFVSTTFHRSQGSKAQSDLPTLAPQRDTAQSSCLTGVAAMSSPPSDSGASGFADSPPVSIGGAVAAKQALFNQSASTVEELFPGTPAGLLMWEKLIECFGVGVSDLPFYDDSKREIIVPHENNRRHQSQVIQAWAFSVMKWGNAPIVRGTAIAVMSHAKTNGQPGQSYGPPYRMIAYNSLSQACYLAHRMAPNNPVVQRTIANGLRNVQLLHPDTPTVALQWIRDWHNTFHNGSSVSFLEVCKASLEIDAAWQVFAFKSGVTSKGKSGETYEALMKKFIDERYPCKIQSMSQFKSARALMNGLKKVSWSDDFELMVGEVCDFTRKDLNHTAAVLNLHSIYVNFAKCMSLAAVGLADLKLAFFEAIKFAVS